MIVAILVLAVGTFALRWVGSRLEVTHPAFASLQSVAIPAILATIIAANTLTVERSVSVDHRLPAVLVAIVAAYRGWSLPAVLGVAVATAILVQRLF